MLDPKDFCKQIIIKDGSATYTFSVVFGDYSTYLRLMYLDTDDLSWSAYEKSSVTRDEIRIPDHVQIKAKEELTSRIQIH